MVDVRNVLVTGMSGTGKSTALAELAQRGFRVVETNRAPWGEWSDAYGGYVWRQELSEELLAHEVLQLLERFTQSPQSKPPPGEPVPT